MLQNCYITLEFITIILRVRHPSVHRIVKKELQLKCLKKINAQELTADNKQARMSSAASEQVSEVNLTVNFVFFTDEKLFTVAAPTNSQNDRFYVRPGTRKKNVNKKPTSSNEIDIQQVSQWTLDRWMPDSK